LPFLNVLPTSVFVKLLLGDGLGVDELLGDGLGVDELLGDGLGVDELLGDGLGADELLGDGVGVDELLGDGVEQLQLKIFCLKESALGHDIPPLSAFLIILWYLYL
jgi:hypothetical protein